MPTPDSWQWQQQYLGTAYPIWGTSVATAAHTIQYDYNTTQPTVTFPLVGMQVAPAPVEEPDDGPLTWLRSQIDEMRALARAA